MSGNIGASLYPLAQPSSMSHVDVSCISGSASMVLHPCITSPRSSLRTLSTDLRSSSGAMKIRFPATWEGEIVSHLTSGRVRHEWEGLRVLKDGPRFTATKGHGSGKLNIWGDSMNVELVGDRMPDLPREEEEEKVEEREREPDSPKEEERQVEEDDDDWTVVGDEDGGQELVKRPPPTYEDATRA